jgi:hypothetical protein
LSDPVAGDELDVSLQHQVIERLPVASPDEVRPERLEHVLQRPHPSPLAHCVADAHRPGQHVGHHHVVGVGTVVHEVDHDVPPGDGVEGLAVLVLGTHSIEEVHQHTSDVVAEPVIGQHVEERHDLVDVALHPHAAVELAHPLGLAMDFHCLLHPGVAQQLLPDGPLAHELVPVQPRPELVQGAEHRPLEAAADGLSGASDCPERESACQERRNGEQRPVQGRQGQTSSGMTPVFSYW